MNNKDIALLKFITRFAYNIDGLPGNLKLYFSQFLTFHFSKRLPVNQIEEVENKEAAKIFNTDDEILSASENLSTDDLIWALASLQLLKSKADESDNRITSRKINDLLNHLLSLLKLVDHSEKISEERKRIEAELIQFQTRPTINVPARIWPLTVDYVIRWILLLLFNYLAIPKEQLTTFTVFLIPLIILVASYFIGRNHRKRNFRLINSYSDVINFQIGYKFTTIQYTQLVFYFVTSVFISYLLPDQLHVLTIISLLIYYLLYLRFFQVGLINENSLVTQLENKEINSRTLSVDENDEAIVALETKLYSSTSRLEAYVLESALFGALSFSGFLQIMAAELISFKDLENFADYIFVTSQAFVHFDWVKMNDGLVGLNSKASLFCLISVESLICSIFFLAVIASRLRFSDIADRVRTAINLAKAYNEKEEAVYDEHALVGKRTVRLEALTTKVNEQIHQAHTVLKSIEPVMAYMRYFRSAGILVFVVIIISSSLFISSTLSWIFLGLVASTIIYFNQSNLIDVAKSFFLSFRIQFIRQGYWLAIVAVFFIVLSYVLKIFFHVTIFLLIPLSLLLIGIYLFCWLMLAAHVDERFGEIEMDIKRLKRWNFIKTAVAFTILTIMVGMTFKELRLDGANALILIGLNLLALLMYFVGYYLSKVKTLGIVMGGTMAIAFVGILFKNLHLEGANEMVTISTLFFFLGVPIIFWQRNIFHQLLKRFTLVSFFICFWYSPFNQEIPLKMQMSYDHETLDIDKIFFARMSNRHQDFMERGEAAINKGIEECNWYMDTFQKRFGFTNVYASIVAEYDEYVLSVMVKETINTELLPLALMAIKQQYKIFELFGYRPIWFEPSFLEADVLMAMGKKQEAIHSIEYILNQKPPIDFKKRLEERLKEIMNN